MVIGIEGEPGSLLLLASPDSSNVQISHALFSRLVQGLDWDFNPRPGLADSWEQSDDGLRWTFHLNPNARWHDGQPVTAADVDFSFNQLFANFSPFAFSWWPNVVSAEPIDDHTFEFRLRAPIADFLLNVGGDPNSVAEIYPAHIYADLDLSSLEEFSRHPTNQAPIASGPFKFKEWVPGSHVELVRNEDFYREGLPLLDRVIFQVASDPSSRTLAFEAGEIDFLYSYNVPMHKLEQYRNDDRYTVVEGGLGIGTIEFLYMNSDPAKNNHLSNPLVRRALAHAINRKDLSEKVMFGQAEVAHSIISSVHPYHRPEYDVYEYDVDQANRLLDEAGFPRGADGTRLDLRITYRTGREFEVQAAEVIRDQLGEVGINLTIQPQDPVAYREPVYVQRDFDLLLQLETTGPGPTKNLSPAYTCANLGTPGNRNPSGWCNDEVEQVIARESEETDPEARAALWARVQELVMQDLPLLPIFEFPNVQLTQSRVREAVTGAVDYEGSREEAWVQD